MKIKIIFFCGHKSDYGIAHLLPILESNFDLIAVVIANEERWKKFRQALLGQAFYKAKQGVFSLSRVKAILSKFLSARIVNTIENKYFHIFHNNNYKILKKYNLNLMDVFDVNNKSFIEIIKGINPELIISAAYPQIFSRELISIPTKGSVNFHPSLLPKYRGAYPHFWSIAKGEENSGLTAHFMTEHIDDGDIIAQIQYPIKQYNLTQLYQKISEETPRIVKMVDAFFNEGNKYAKPQNSIDATLFREPREIHSRIFWNIHSTEEIFNLVRTETAYFFINVNKIKVLKAAMAITNRNLTNNVRVEPGTLVDVSRDYVAVKTIDGCINIEEIEENGNMFLFRDWVNKYQFAIGSKLI